MKSPIIYYGGKSSMLTNILPLIPPHKVYTEVFFGGGSVFWAKKPSFNETINDKLDIVVNFYQVLKLQFDALWPLIDASCYSRTLHRQATSIVMGKIKADTVKRAWAFWFSSNHSYGCKLGAGFKYSNQQNQVPPQVMVNNKKAFTKLLQHRIEGCSIENKDALEVLISRNVADAFHYLDPPYPGADQGHYRGYTWEEYHALLTLCETLKGRFMLSNYNSPMLDEFIQRNGWWKKEYKINNKGMRRNDAAKVEVLVCNYVPTGVQELNF